MDTSLRGHCEVLLYERFSLNLMKWCLRNQPVNVCLEQKYFQCLVYYFAQKCLNDECTLANLLLWFHENFKIPQISISVTLVTSCHQFQECSTYENKCLSK